ncbi:MAG TPA: GTP cyclohydrolase FolE2 [candidate division Zixibacteria bacterium]|nr:GTP cyclohydrolase FolE2 [candidate division Zixibacteria bacterium]
MPDVQSQPDARQVPLNKVGIADIKYPVRVLDRENRSQDTVATINLSVNLPHEYRGTHLSRFVEALCAHHERIGVGEIAEILTDVKERLQSAEAHIDVYFPYFISRSAPVSGAEALMEYHCGFEASYTDALDFVLLVEVPVTTLCPCSKEISAYGAHNQRATVTVRCRFTDFVWLEELIEIVESCASSPVYPLLKREDEKAVTEAAYDNPRFVEDVVREVALRLDDDARVTAYQIQAKSFESIHNHNAVALVQRNWPAE